MAMIVLLDIIGKNKEIKTMPIQEGKSQMKLKIMILNFKMFILDMMIIQ